MAFGTLAMRARCARPAESSVCSSHGRRLAPLFGAVLLYGCAAAPPSAPPREPDTAALGAPEPAFDADPGSRVLAAATALLGAPYRLGAAGPDAFDCSGLVHFAHLGIGLRVPRTAAAQRLAAAPVPSDALRAGDLLFFRMSGSQIDHVGIYAGDGQFIHAPGAGRGVERARLDAPWYFGRFAGAGRLWQPAVSDR